MGWLWVLVTGLGVIALFAAMYFARSRNKHDDRGSFTDRGAGCAAGAR